MASVFKRNGKGSYIIQYYDHNGRRREKSSRTTDKRTAERIAAKMEGDVALRREGVVDPQMDVVASAERRLLAEHIADFETKMVADDRSDQHIRETVGFIKKINNVCQFTVPSDIQVDAVNQYVVDLRGTGKSTRRINAIVAGMKSFTRWMVAHGKLPMDPLASLRLGNVKTDRRYERRAYTVDEFRYLIQTTYHGPMRYGMTGLERGLLYTVAVQTGLRSNELRSLTAAKFNLNRIPPTVSCKAKATKNSKDAHQYLRPETAADLEEYLRTKAPAARAFNMPRENLVIEMLRADLADACEVWINEVPHDPKEQARRRESDFLACEDATGHKLDFHSLRYTTGALLAMQGVHPKKIQRVMRHSTITLTMDTYGDLLPGEEAETVNHFPDMTLDKTQSMQATGTNDIVSDQYRVPPSNPQQIPQQLERESVQRGAVRRESVSGKDHARECQTDHRKHNISANLDESVRRGATPNKVMPVEGLEPTPCCQERILNPSRLPIPPHRPYPILRQCLAICQIFLVAPCYGEPIDQRGDAKYGERLPVRT